MASLKRDLNCPRRMVIYALFDILDQIKGRYEQSIVGDIRAEAEVLGKKDIYAFAVTEVNPDISILHISMLRSDESETEEDKEKSIEWLMTRIIRHIDEVRECSCSVTG